MSGRLMQMWFLLAVCLTPPAAAQAPRPLLPKSTGNALPPAIRSLFQETEAERQTIENVAIDDKQERRIGDDDLAAYLRSLKDRGIRITQRGRDFEYVSTLADLVRGRMQHAARYPKIRVYIAETGDTDARAFPGGSIVVMTGLIELAESEAALVGVLGHELSHIDHGHQLRMHRAVELTQNGWQGDWSSPESFQRHFMTLAKSFARPFRQEDEVAADQDGATWAAELGYEPLELAQLFERMTERQARRPTNAAAHLPSFLLTHPSYDNRSAAIRRLAGELRRAAPDGSFYIGRANHSQRITRQIRVFPE